MKDLNGSNPVELAENEIANQIDNEPAFKGWIRTELQRRVPILKKHKRKYWRMTYKKFGIEVPKDVLQAQQIDKDTNMTY
jgi:hypothetical protein